MAKLFPSQEIHSFLEIYFPGEHLLQSFVTALNLIQPSTKSTILIFEI